ncbi:MULTISPECIES: hypothetical protein [Protofrankia]|uniref:hypothetical protein n=1 Tax=Protofrankia TaxID=2994361 RepID=UPI0006994127|nr:MULTISPECIES: hypothetical protein [Protofrankia]ONH31781.1 hypothetical protein BL254_22700 [Protofrankia sp. BMG5.30]
MTALAAEVSRQTGEEIAYQDLPPAEFAKALVGFGVPEMFADILAASDAAIAQGEVDSDRRDPNRLIGRATTSLADAVTAAVKG